MQEFFVQRGGVAQGCPASGWVFIIAFDPRLRMLREELGSQGGVGCANVAVCRCWEGAMGLGIHPTKTVVIPIVGQEVFEAARDGIRGFLEAQVPHFARRVAVVHSCQIAGFRPGIQDQAEAPTEPMAKWRRRVADIGSTGI